MNYIELFGLSTSGKTYFKNKMFRDLKKKKKKILDQKIIIIQFFLKNKNIKFKNYLKLQLLLLFYSNFSILIKSFFKRKRTVKKSKNKIYFSSSKKKWYHLILDSIGLETQYLEILRILEKQFKVKDKNLLYRIILKDISKLKKNSLFKNKLKKWFLENVILIEILKKEKDIYCIVDEGILQKIFIMFGLIKNNRSFIKRIIKYIDNYGNIYLVQSNLKEIQRRSLERQKKSSEFIYQSYQQIVKEYNKLKIFEKLIKNKIIYKKIFNN